MRVPGVLRHPLSQWMLGVAVCLLVLATPMLGLLVEWGTNVLRWGIKAFFWETLGLELNI